MLSNEDVINYLTHVIQEVTSRMALPTHPMHYQIVLGLQPHFQEAKEVPWLALSTSLASLKHWPFPQDITGPISVLAGIYPIHI